MKEDNRKLYFLLEKDDIESRNRDAVVINNCAILHMIAFSPNGQIQTKINICSCEECIVGNFVKCNEEQGKFVFSEDGDSESESDREEESDSDREEESDSDREEESDSDREEESDSDDEEEMEENEILPEVMFDEISIGSCIALYSDTNSWEPFILCKVLDIKVAAKDYIDSNGHMIYEGKKFITAFYYKKNEKQKMSGKSGKVKFDLWDDNEVYVLPESIFYPCVNMSDNCLTISEYLFLCDCV